MQRVQVAFTSQVSLNLWSQYLNQGDVQLVEIVLRSENFSAQQAELKVCITAGELLPLLLERGECLRLILADDLWQAGDRITYLLHKSISFKAFIFSQPNPAFLALKDTSQLNLD